MKASSIGEVIHKEKKQKKHNKTTGQLDKLKKYSKQDDLSRDNLTTAEKQIERETKFIKNLHIDTAYDKLVMKKLVTDPKYELYYFKAMHTLGVVFVMAQAERALQYARDPENPAPLFHFLINKAMNKAVDPTLPRFH